MIDLDRLRRALLLGTLGAVSMALLLPPLALMRYTDAQDWYAARKVSVAQALIFVGFDERASTKYRLADGRTVTWLRDGVATYPAALRSRSHILAVIGDNILLGACAGFVVVFTLSGLLNLARHESAGVSRAAERRPSAAERRPGFLADVSPYAARERKRCECTTWILQLDAGSKFQGSSSCRRDCGCPAAIFSSVLLSQA